MQAYKFRIRTTLHSLICIGFILLISPVCKASQKKDTARLSDRQLLKLGRNDQKTGLIRDAEYYYQAYYLRHPKRIDIAWKLGEMYRVTSDYEDALKYYVIVYNLNLAKNLPVAVWYDFIGESTNTSRYRKYPLAGFYEGLMLKRIGKYKMSTNAFSGFISNYHEKDAAYYQGIVFKEIEGNNLALKLLANPDRIKLVPLREFYSNYNYYIAYAPQLFHDSTILFDAARLYFTGPYALPVTEIRYAKCKKDTWSDAGTVYGKINDNRFLTLGGCFSQDQKRYYFTRCEIRYNFSMQGSPGGLYLEKLGIYVCSYTNGEWGVPKRLDTAINQPGSINIMPALGMDERHRDVLYFVSNRVGGQGGFDIWRSTFASGRNAFDNPVNLGKQINTVENEITPFYDQDSATLYFSSNGWPGLGGLDIFRTTRTDGEWKTPVNLGKPYNSRYDDKYFITNPDHSFGMFNRSTRCNGDQFCVWQYIRLPFFSCDSIWTFKRPLPQITVQLRVVGEVGQDTIFLKGAVITMNAVNRKTMKEEFLFTKMNQKGDGLIVPLHTRNLYHVHVSKEGFYPTDTSINTDSCTVSQTFHYLFRLQKIPIDTPVAIRNIIFDFGDSILSRKSELILDSTILRYLQKHPDEKVMVISHTDSIGSNEDNMKLSLARARSIVSYLVTRGISPKRMTARGYGSRFPVAPNKHRDGTDNPEGREQNRRSEFRVIGKMK